MESIKTAVIYDPYLDTLGGGERYTLTVADILGSLGWQVLLAWENPSIIENARKRFSLALNNVAVDAEYFNLFTQKSDLLTRRQALKNLDLVFVVSDGPIPILFGRKTILHYQVPFTRINSLGIINTIKLASISHIVVNSLFTKNVIDRTLGTQRTEVMYPPVDVDIFRNSSKKEKIILNVGRFASPSHSKRQDILIAAFKTLVDRGLKDWKLILAGGKFGEDSDLTQFQQEAKDYPIEFIINPEFDELKKLYAKSSLYWHAAGFEVDEKINPESVEHFGITTVEAMASGCVPLVANKGGQKEIVTSKEGILWDTLDQLVEHTTNLIKDQKKLKQLSIDSQKRSQKFSVSNFRKTLLTLTI